MHVYLAAAESEIGRILALQEEQAPYILSSYYYAPGLKGTSNAKARQWCKMMLSAPNRLIDSGAFTLRTSVMSLVSTGGNQQAVSVDYDKFLVEYMAWLKLVAAHGMGDFWVEVDIAAVTSHAWVERQRNAMIAAGLGRGLINVWHSDQDWDYWLYLLREAKRDGRSNYVAIEGHQLDRAPLDYTRFLHAAYQRGVKVHGFRMTNNEALKRWPFYSVDSSSWSAVTTYGSSICFVRTGGVASVNANKSELSEGLRRSWIGSTRPHVFTLKHRYDALRASARVWIKASRDLTAMWEKRGVRWDEAIANPKVTA